MQTGKLLILAVALFIWAGSNASAAKFEDAKLSWSGNHVHADVKTDLSDGKSVMMSVSARTPADVGVRAQFLGRVKNGHLIGNGIAETVKDTIEDHINMEPSHSLLVIYAEDGDLRSFEFASTP